MRPLRVDDPMRSIILGVLLSVGGSAQDTEPLEPRYLPGFEEPLQKLALSPDGRILLGASGGSLYAWDFKQSHLRWHVPSSRADIVALGVGEELVAFHRGSGALLFADLETGKSRGGQNSFTDLTSLLIDPKDRWVWLGREAGFVRREVRKSLKSWSRRAMSNGGVTCLAQDATAKTLVVGGRNGTVRFVGAKSANTDKKKILEGHLGPVSAVALDPRGKVVVSASELGEIRVWTASSGRQLREMRAHEAAVVALAVDPKGKRLASGDAQGVVHIWDLKKGELLGTLPGQEGGAVTGLAFINKGSELAVAREQARLALWPVAKL